MHFGCMLACLSVCSLLLTLLLVGDTEDKAAIQLDADILEHLVKKLTASHARKEADIERIADELNRGEVPEHTTCHLCVRKLWTDMSPVHDLYPRRVSYRSLKGLSFAGGACGWGEGGRKMPGCGGAGQIFPR